MQQAAQRSSLPRGPPPAAAAARGATPTSTAASVGVRVGAAPLRRRATRRAAASGERDGPAASSNGGTTTTTTTTTTTPPPPPPRPPPDRRPRDGGTRVGDLVRATPFLNRFSDGTLVLGDAVMVASTQLSSERIAWGDEAAPLLFVSVGCWILAAAARGDYLPDKRREYDDPLSLMMGFPVLIGIADACVTWAVAVVPAMGLDAWLAASFLVDPLAVAAAVSPKAAAATAIAAGTFARGAAAGPEAHALSPQLEVLVAMLITMSSWRGIAAWVRLSSG